jgi:hypothetical protein
MSSTPDVLPVCEWTHSCSNAAAKHLIVGLRIFEPQPADVQISDMPYDQRHLDLCDEHAELAASQYVQVEVFELGQCRTQHGQQAAGK